MESIRGAVFFFRGSHRCAAALRPGFFAPDIQTLLQQRAAWLEGWIGRWALIASSIWPMASNVAIFLGPTKRKRVDVVYVVI